MRIIQIFVFVLIGLPLSQSFAETKHGITIEMNQGLGYTLYVNKFWTGISVNVGANRFEPKQVIVTPRIFFNYDAVALEKAALFVGGSYADSFGLSNDRHADKHRVLALTGGLNAEVSERVRLAAWVNLYGIYETETYDPATDIRSFTNPNRRTDFDFGGISLSYLF